jgi:tRNA A-37 threonylcarbamoyl transferase component Bud32
MTTTEIDPPIERFGPFLLQGLIGRGGMGEVHRAVDTAHDGRLVALKLLPAELSDDPERRARFRREAEIVAGLGEPHVVPVHGYGEIDGRLFLDMELVDGPDLGAYLAGGGPMPPALAVAIVEQVATALDGAHGADLVHHDVKPSNVLVRRPEPGRIPHVLLADFGVAGDARGLGTVEYLAPERIQGHAGDHRVDVYALACVLFELLTGARVFPGAEFAAQAYGHLHRPPPRPSTLLTAVPPDLDAVVLRGLAKGPDERFPAAGVLAAQARAALGDDGAARRPTRRQVLIAAATGIATVGAGLAVGQILGRDPAPAVPQAAPAPQAGAQPTAASVSPFGTGPPPEPVIIDRAIGARSTEREPFVLAPVAASLMAMVLTVDGYQGWDLTTDTPLGPLLSRAYDGPIKNIRTVALADVDGTPVLCSAGYDQHAVVRTDLRTGAPVGAPLPTGAPAEMLTVVTLDGAPVLLSFGEGGVLARHDLRTGAPVGPPAPGLDVASAFAPRVVRLHGRPCLVTTNDSDVLTQTVRDAATLEEVGRTGALHDVVAEMDGTPVSLAAVDSLEIRDLATGEVLRQMAAPGATTAAAATLDGRLVVAADTASGEIVLFDANAQTRIGSPLEGHAAQPTALEVAMLGDRPVLVSAALDNAVRVWDLAVHAYAS